MMFICVLTLTWAKFVGKQEARIQKVNDEAITQRKEFLDGYLKTLDGEHELRRIGKKDVEQTAIGEFKTHHGYFLFSGSSSVNGNYTENTKQTMTFAWEFEDNTYAMSKIEIIRVRVLLDDSVKIPTISFYYAYGDIWGINMQSLQEVIDDIVVYVVIKCNNEQWPQSIEMP
ncbi:MAG: hypothetical protein PHH83_04945 [Patescibacteria group bacterium]|nr:hypothetical protein [Patescibacteria group bacterium]